MSNSTPLVSIIMPAYNAENYISEAIVSVRDQTWQKWELIVVNDGSTDSTGTIVATFCQTDSRVRLITQPNGKLPKARNTGIGVASGEFVAFLDADDMWHPTKLEKQLESWRETKADVVFSDAFHFPENLPNLPTHLFGKFSGFASGPEMFERLYEGNAIPVSSVLLHFSGPVTECRFDESLVRGLEDYEMWLRLAARGASFFGMEEKLVGYRSHPEQMSRQVIPMLRSAIAVRQKYRPMAEKGGIDLVRQDRIDYRNVAYCSCNDGDREAAWSAIWKLCDARRFGLRGLVAAAGTTLHMLFHFVRPPAHNLS
jgi:glycosyltransferase involved in cell wall biosynthesis